MASKEPSTPKAKATKPVKGGIVKRTPVKVSPTKATSGPTIDKNLVFLWKCVNMSTGMKINWVAVANDAGKSTSTVQKQYSRLNAKLEKYVATMGPDVAPDNEDDTNDKVIQTVNSESE
ncbi:hypothetical protein N7491_007696 [Penicillium cf. griseofulvum]|uniref:Myb-like DNA-binding domain-containing protein n=1 Tax=Penicillium cf. griseofulvum TaxID=2972120 RepID=A0A9W9ISV5_9EURO|nr:hypothetical protein N7472_009279 [Penicillium cf. griseofulvum]KAJ5430680.1 hypothetical protein N7491_007696 [Penicillium cf. griseofulvum]KAJ5435551.1 hypothetical protein N7445_006436 [Penicillium cf. griseofulvum]